MPDFGFLAILLGSVVPNIALIKAKEELVEFEPVYPMSIVSDEEKNNILIHTLMKKRK
jgi:hypothetical protein